MLSLRLPLAALLLAATPVAAMAAPPVTSALPAMAQEAPLVPTGDPVGDPYDRYASSVALSGETLACRRTTPVRLSWRSRRA